MYTFAGGFKTSLLGKVHVLVARAGRSRLQTKREKETLLRRPKIAVEVAARAHLRIFANSRDQRIKSRSVLHAAFM